MGQSDSFAETCRRICAEQGWELLPTGIHIRWPDGRQQLVDLSFFEAEGVEMVRLSTTIGAAEALSNQRLRAALEINATLAHGAFAVADRHLIMTDTLLLRDARPEELESALRHLARTADNYESALYGTDDF